MGPIPNAGSESGHFQASGHQVALNTKLAKETMGPKTQELVAVLDETIALLRGDGEDNWSRSLGAARARLLDSDFGGIAMLLAAFGGMGSFSDLIIGLGMDGGRFARGDGYREKNGKLTDLRNRIWELADAIKRDHEMVGAEPEDAGADPHSRQT